MSRTRCGWVNPANALYVAYHDEEWGVPVHDDRRLFEMLILEGAQAGLSWETILKKRANYRAALDGFDPESVARYDAAKEAELLADAGIVRNRLKIRSLAPNARAFLALAEEHGSFASWLWDHVDGTPVRSAFRSLAEYPAKTPLSDTISKRLKKRGMNFVGSTIVYAYLQAVGVVDDHQVDCFRRTGAE